MIGKQYKAHKDNVIDLFNGYAEKKGNLHDGIDLSFLKSRINSLINNKFTLAVAGEVKAGKSTFINALLGAEILPADVLQATSAIVEISKSEKSCLKVKYADEKEVIIYDNLETPDIDEAKERLNEICKITDEYREIPTTLIDTCIVDSSTKLKVDTDFINMLQRESGKPLQDKNDIVMKYIESRPQSSIPIKIDFGYPLKWAFDELRIADTPGVNATGGVQNISFRFFEEADAILFIHPFEPIESESFSKFVSSVIPNRSKETLFLIITHAGVHPDEEVNRVYIEAKRLYKKLIPEERILVVDSLLELIYYDFLNGKTVKEIRKSKKKKMILASYKEKAEDEDRDLKDVVSKASRFGKMVEAINKFSMNAPNLQLQEILESIRSGYENQDNQYKEKLELLGKKKENPQKFENAIDRINAALEKYKSLIYRTKEDLTSDYTGKHSEWNKNIDKLKVEYPKLITNSENFEIVRKNYEDGKNEIEDMGDNFSKSITKELSKKLKESGRVFQKEYKITIPQTDLRAIEKKTKQDAYKNELIYEQRKEPLWKFWKWGNRDYKVKTGEKSVYNETKHLNSFKIECKKEFYELVNILSPKSKEVFDRYMNSFQSEINSIIEKRQEALRNEKSKKQSNDEIIKEIEQLDKKKAAIQPELKRIKEILENL